jgi:hypothetical protein
MNKGGVRAFLRDIDPDFPKTSAGLKEVALKYKIPIQRQDMNAYDEIPLNTNNVQKYYHRYNFMYWVIRQKPRRRSSSPTSS